MYREQYGEYVYWYKGVKNLAIRSVFSSSVPNHRFWPLKCFLYELMIQMIHSTSVALNIFTFKKMSLSVSNLFLSDLRTSINLLVLSIAFTSTKPTFSRSYLKRKKKNVTKALKKEFLITLEFWYLCFKFHFFWQQSGHLKFESTCLSRNHI